MIITLPLMNCVEKGVGKILIDKKFVEQLRLAWNDATVSSFNFMIKQQDSVKNSDYYKMLIEECDYVKQKSQITRIDSLQRIGARITFLDFFEKKFTGKDSIARIYIIETENSGEIYTATNYVFLIGNEGCIMHQIGSSAKGWVHKKERLFETSKVDSLYNNIQNTTNCKDELLPEFPIIITVVTHDRVESKIAFLCKKDDLKFYQIIAP